MSTGKHEARFALRLALACTPALAGWLVLRHTGASPADLLETIGPVSGRACVAGIALLPLFGFPLAPLYAFAGLRYGWAGYAFAVLGVAVNLALAHPLYGALLRRPALALLRRRGYDPEQWRGGVRWRVTLLIATIPALPFWAQNAVLAALDTPFRLFFPISLAAQALFALGGVALGVLGREALTSPSATILLLLSLPLSLLLLRRIKLKRTPSAEPSR